MNAQHDTPGPILCAYLLRAVDEKLIELLRSLSAEEWELQTVAPLWKVRDVAAHLLDTVLRKLSLVRDGSLMEAVEVRSSKDLTELINRLNREGVAVYRRLSPKALISMLEMVCGQSADFHESLDPFAPAAFGVSWAGEERLANWFDTARELTERWHHQQQIRLVTNRPGILTREFYYPVLDCFLRALPYHYRNFDAPDATALIVEVSGECGGCWNLVRERDQWRLLVESTAACAARVTIPQELAWRLFTKGISPDAAREAIRIEGNQALGGNILQLTAIVG
jgi:uncharacterized protein (TIGR03083 family)